MRKVTDAAESERSGPLFICDFSPPRGGPPEVYTDAAELTSDFISVAYNPGRAVRTDSVAVAAHITTATGTDAIFNLSPRDMNKIALQSRLLGAQLLGLSNLIVVQGDKITEHDNTQAVAEYTSTGLVEAIAQMNSGVDFRGVNLRAPTDFCIGAALDLGRGVESEARLAYRRVLAGAHFFITQPVFNPAVITEFNAAYEELAGAPLGLPVFWGLQILMADGVLFSNVPEDLTRDLSNGRDGVDIALETYALLAEAGIDTTYLVAPIMRGGARDYKAARRFLDAVRM